MKLGSILVHHVLKTTRSIPIMDQFEEKTANGDRMYDTLFLQDICCMKVDKKLYWIGLYVQRQDRQRTCIHSNLTFSDLKRDIVEKVFIKDEKYNQKIINAIFDGSTKIRNFKDVELKDYFFETPIRFNAQNSVNRCGYGNRYVYDELVYEGTLYGETIDYMFVGVQYRQWKI